MIRLRLAIWLLEQLATRDREQLTGLRIDDDVKLALQILHRARRKTQVPLQL